MTIPVLPPYNWPNTPVPHVTPFTFRDGYSYEQRFRRLVKYLNDEVIQYINENVPGLAQQFVDEVNRLITEFNEITADITDSSAIAVAAAEAAEASALLAEQYASDAANIQDAAITGIFNNAASQFRQAANAAYATKATQTTVETGRLSSATLDARFTAKADQSALTTLSGTVTTLSGTVTSLGTDVDAVEATVASMNAAVTANTANVGWLYTALDEGFRPTTRLISYGHSFLAEQGLGSSADYYARKIANLYELAYPTDVTTNDLKRAAGGEHAEETAWKMFGNAAANGWTVGTDATLIIEALINTLRLNGVDSITKRGAEWAYRTMCGMAASDNFFSCSDTTFFTYDAANWTFAPDPIYYGGNVRSTSFVGNKVKFKNPSDGSHVALLARKAGLAAAVTTITRSDTGAVLTTFNNTDQARSTLSGNYVPALIEIKAPAGVEIVVTATSGTTSFVGVFDRADNPLPVILMKEPYLDDYTASTSYPNGSDAAVDSFNQIIDDMASRYRNVIAVDPNLYWTNANAATMVQSDKVHPNVAGNDALFKATRDTIRRRGLSTLVRY